MTLWQPRFVPIWALWTDRGSPPNAGHLAQAGGQDRHCLRYLAVHGGLSLVENSEFEGPLDLDEATANFLGGPLVPLSPSGLDVEMDVDWYDTISVVPCHQNLSRISCPSCGASIDTEWWADLLEERNDIGFDDLLVAVPCCRARTSLDALQYDLPCGFARFEIAIWNPDGDWFTDEEMASLANALGHPVNQIMAHI